MLFKAPRLEITKKTLISWLITITIFGLFLIMYFALVFHFTGDGIFSFCPSSSDERFYYRMINTAVNEGLFSENAGYNGSYDGSETYTAHCLFYSTKGVFYVIPFYIVGKVVGWTTYTPLIANIIFLFISVNILHFCIEKRKRTLCVLLVLLYFPMIRFIGSGMLEVLVISNIVVIASVLYRYHLHPRKLTLIVLIILIALNCMLRISNIVFFIPIVFILAKNKRFYYHLIYFVIAMIFSFGIKKFNGLFSAGGGGGGFLNNFYVALNDSILSGFNLLAGHLVSNIRLYFNVFDMKSQFVFLRMSLILLLLICTFSIFFVFNSKGKIYTYKKPIDQFLLSLSLVISGSIFLVVAFYDIFDWRDYRALSPILLFAILSLIMRCEKYPRISCSAILIVILFLSFGFSLKDGIETHFGQETHMPISFPSNLHYNKYAIDRWDNTVLRSPKLMFTYDSGIGIITSRVDTINEKTIKTKYILWSDKLNFDKYELVDSLTGEWYLYARD
jgi:hypothetical protein